MTLKELRQSLGLTQEKFSERLGIKRGTYAQYESERLPISLKFARIVSKTFDVKIDVTLTDVTFRDPAYCACGNDIKVNPDVAQGVCGECR